MVCKKAARFWQIDVFITIMALKLDRRSTRFGCRIDHTKRITQAPLVGQSTFGDDHRAIHANMLNASSLWYSSLSPISRLVAITAATMPSMCFIFSLDGFTGRIFWLQSR